MLTYLTKFLLNKILSHSFDKIQKNWSEKWLDSVQRLSPFPISISSHLKELEAKVRAMPFIYKNIDTDIMNDFVEVEIEPLDLGTLRIKSTKIKIAMNERLKHKKIIFLGGGGIGKTTFQRHTILDLINGKASFPEKDERLVPFYIPLKAVENSSSFPILEYLLEKNRLLSGDSGIKRLIKLAQSNRLFLFLDGYDEIQFISSSMGHNYVRSELSLIMSGKSTLPENLFKKSVPPNHDYRNYQKFYQALAYCRTWLSSRREFFAQHPINTSNSFERLNLYPVELTGISNRSRLAKNIFNKYPGYTDKLSAEHFIREIDAAEEADLKSFSRSPLFLTVMCYIYATKVTTQNDFEISWLTSFNELILECINLLLHDLDKDKARELEGAHKRAFEDRRGRYLKEKEAFLPYFASQLFREEGTNLFDVPYIKSEIEQFLKTEYDSPIADRIIRELHDEEANDTNMGRQLIDQGLFVLIDRNNDTALYDFPHRRFREVLAAKYFDEHDFEYVIDNLRREELSELLYVFFNLTSSKDKVLEAILKKIKDDHDADFHEGLLLNCLGRKPATYNPGQVFRSFFVDCLNSNNHPNLTADTLNYFHPKDDFTELLSQQFKQSVVSEKVFSTSLCFQLLLRENPLLLKELCKDHLITRFENNNFLALVMLTKYPIMGKWFREATTLNERQNLFIYLAGIFDSIYTANQGIQHSQKDLGFCYILTDQIINKTEHLIKDKKSLLPLKDLKYKVHFSDNFLNRKDIKIDDKARDVILENSRVDHKGYEEITRTIDQIKYRDPTSSLFRR